MACTSIVALSRSCGAEGIVAGLEKLWVVSHQDLGIVSGTTNSYTLSIDGIVNHVELSTGKKFVEVGLLKSTSGLKETLTKDATKGTAYFTQDMTLVLGGLTIENENFLKSVLNQPVAVLVKTRTGKYKVAGLNGQFELSAAEGGTGTAEADLQGYTLTFAGLDNKTAPFVDPTAVPGLVA